MKILCPRAAKLGRRYIYHPMVTAFETIIKDITLRLLKDPEYPLWVNINRIVLQHLSPIKKYIKDVYEPYLAFVTRIVAKFIKKDYVPLLGPVKFPINYKDVTMKLDVISVWINKTTRQYFVWVKSPYRDEFSIQNDYIDTVKAYFLRHRLLRKTGYDINFYIVWTDKEHTLRISRKKNSTLSGNGLREINPLMDLLSLDVGYPTLPCPDRKCPVRKECLNEKIWTRVSDLE